MTAGSSSATRRSTRRNCSTCKNDPFELHDLAGKPESAGKVQDLTVAIGEGAQSNTATSAPSLSPTPSLPPGPRLRRKPPTRNEMALAAGRTLRAGRFPSAWGRRSRRRLAPRVRQLCGRGREPLLVRQCEHDAGCPHYSAVLLRTGRTRRSRPATLRSPGQLAFLEAATHNAGHEIFSGSPALPAGKRGGSPLIRPRTAEGRPGFSARHDARRGRGLARAARLQRRRALAADQYLRLHPHHAGQGHLHRLLGPRFLDGGGLGIHHRRGVAQPPAADLQGPEWSRRTHAGQRPARAALGHSRSHQLRRPPQLLSRHLFLRPRPGERRLRARAAD